MLYLKRGQLVSTSGFRYARELDAFRGDQAKLSNVRLIQAVVLNDFIKYGIHMLDAISVLGIGTILSMTRLGGAQESYLFELSNGSTFILSCLGEVIKTFHINIYGTQGHFDCHLRDNFSAFRRTLQNFCSLFEDDRVLIDPYQVRRTMNILMNSQTMDVGQTIELGDE